MSTVRIALLQAFRVTIDDRPAIFRSRKARALLAYLAAEPRPQQRTALAGLLWPDTPQPVALHNLSQTLLYVRAALHDTAAAPRLLVTRQTIALRPAAADWIDLAALEAHLRRAAEPPHSAPDHGTCPVCQPALEAAAEIYVGPLLDDLALGDSDLFEEWLLQRRERLQREVVGALERLAAAYAAQRADDRLEPIARQLLVLEPLREAAHRMLMRALVQQGQRAAALAQYDQCRRLLAAELGIEPDLETTALAAQIRAEAIPLTGAPRGWSTIPEPGPVYGRQQEIAALSSWLRDPECRVVALLGMGGIGKTTLAAKVSETVAASFTQVLWRSLLNAPPLAEVIRSWLQLLGAGPTQPLPDDAEAQIDALLAALGTRHCLLVLDNLESLLAEHEPTGLFRPGAADYARLIWRFGQGRQPSRLLVTSRERPAALARLERAGTAVRILSLTGLPAVAVQAILAAEGLPEDQATSAALGARYSGNPLAIRLVADTIRELFGRDVTAFMRDAAPIFSDIRDVLDQQIARLSPLEQTILTWLAVERDPIPFDALHELLADHRPRYELLEGVAALRRRSLLEAHDGTVGLQNVVLEYLTEQFVAAVVAELETEPSDTLARFALLRPQAREYVRQSQEQLLVRPVVERLVAGHGRAATEALLRAGLAKCRAAPRVGYSAGNLINLLLASGADLRGLDCAGLCVWNADLRGVILHAANFAGADLRGTAFTDAFRAVAAVAYSPDGALLAAGTSDGSLRLWRADGQLLQICVGHTALVWAVAFSPDGTLLASAAMDRTVRIWRAQTGEPLLTLAGAAGGVVAVAFSPDGAYVAAAGFDPEISVWDVTSGALVQTIAGHVGATLSLTYSPDGSALLSGGLDRRICIWDRASGQLLRSLEAHTAGVLKVAFRPDGALLASAAHDRTVLLWDAHSWEVLRTLRGHTDVVTACGFSPDGQTLASASWDRRIILWDVVTGALRTTFLGHTTHIGGICYSPNGLTIASGGFDQTVRIWEAASGRLLTVLRGHTSWVWSLAWSADGTTLASSHQDGLVCRWLPQIGALAAAWRAADGEVSSLAFRPDGTLVTGGRDRLVRLWRGERGEVLYEHTAGVSAISVRPGDGLIVSAGLDGGVLIWDAQRGQVEPLARGQTHSALPLAFGAAGALLALPDAEHGIQLWDVAQRSALRRLTGHSETVLALAFNPNGARLASAGQDSAVRLWDAANGTLRQELRGQGAWFFALAFSPDAATLAGGSDDGCISLWDAATGALRAVLTGHLSWVFALAFSPDGATLASGSDDGTVRLWDPANGTCLRVLVPPGPYAGMRIDAADGLSSAQRSALLALGARV